MPINKDQLKELVIVPTLQELGLYSTSAVNLLLGTCAQESHMGTYLKQIGGGPALGIYQMEPATERDLIKNYIRYRMDLHNKMMRFPRYEELYQEIINDEGLQG